MLDQLAEKFRDIRGELGYDKKLMLDGLRKEIVEQTKMKSFAENEQGKKLINAIHKTLVEIDRQLDSGKIDTVKLLAERKAWITVLQTMQGGSTRLEAIKSQIDYYLKQDN